MCRHFYLWESFKSYKMRLSKTTCVCFDTVKWDNGIDLDPEYLYKNSQTYI